MPTAPRALWGTVVQDSEGDVQTTQVYIYETDGTTLLAQSMYGTADSGVPLSNPLTPNARGFVVAYVPIGQRAVATVGGISYPIEFSHNPSIVLTGSGPSPWVDPSIGYGAQFDGISRQTGTTVSGSPLVTVPISGPHTGFTSADVGKRIVVIELTGTGNSAVETNRATGTISQVVSTTQVIMSVNASASISGTAIVIWGTDDTAAIQAAFDAWQTADDPITVEWRLPRGIAMISGDGLALVKSCAALAGAGGFADPSSNAYGTMLVGCTSGMSILKVQGDDHRVSRIALNGAGKLAAIGLDMGTGTGGTLASPQGTNAIVHRTVIDQAQVSGCNVGILVDGEHYNTDFYSCHVLRCTSGTLLRRVNTSGVVQKVNFYAHQSEVCSTVSVKVDTCELVNFYGGSFQFSPIGLQLSSAAYIYVNGIQFEGNSTASVDLVSAVSASFDNNWFTTFVIGIRGVDSSYCRIGRNAWTAPVSGASKYWDFTSGNSNCTLDPYILVSGGVAGDRVGLFSLSRASLSASAADVGGGVALALPSGSVSAIDSTELTLAIGDWTIRGIFDFLATANDLVADGAVFTGGIDDISGSVSFDNATATANFAASAAGQRATVVQEWKATVGLAGGVVKLTAGKTAGSGTSSARSGSTRIIATYHGGT